MKQLLHSGPTLIIAIPTLGRPIPMEWALAFKNLNPPINFNTTFHFIKGREIGEARQEMALNAINSGAKYIFFLGDDVEVPNHSLRQMIYKMEQRNDIGVIGGVYCAKADPAYPLVFRGFGNGSYWDWKIGEFFEVDGLGMDATLIRVDLLKELYNKAKDKPLFKTVHEDQFLDAINNAEQWTEDLYFFKRVGEEQSKYKVFCDGGVICQHWDVYGGRSYSLPKDSLPMRQLATPGELKRLLDVGSHMLDQKELAHVRISDRSDEVDYRCDYSSIPFESGSFDIISANGNCLNDTNRIPVILDEFTRLLKDNGTLVLSFSNLINQSELCFQLTNRGFSIKEGKPMVIEAIKNVCPKSEVIT